MGDGQERRSKRRRQPVDYARLDSTGYTDRVQYKKLGKAVLRWPEGTVSAGPSVKTLPADRLAEYIHSTGFRDPCVVRATTDASQALGIRLPEGELTLQQLSRLVGMDKQVNTIDVSTQSEGPLYSMAEWMDYYYKSSRKPLLNVVSLELANTPAQELMSSPSLVKELDLVDRNWPPSHLPIPKVQLYALMSVAGCFMDFHVDFGGSSVWYHVLSGRKVFLLVPPTKGNLAAFEEWSSSDRQASVFFAERSSGCQRLELSAGDTLLLPGGWPHCVATPEDSLVIGGNFLTGYNLPLQLDIWKMEERLKVQRKFRFPLYKQLMWHTAANYLELLRKVDVEQCEEKKQLSKWEKAGIGSLVKILKLWMRQTRDAEVPDQIKDVPALLEGLELYTKKEDCATEVDMGPVGSTTDRLVSELFLGAPGAASFETLRSTPPLKEDNAEELSEEDDHNPPEDVPDDLDEDFQVAGLGVSDEDSPRAKKKAKPGVSKTKKEPGRGLVAGGSMNSAANRSPAATKSLEKSKSTTVRERLMKKVGHEKRVPMNPKFHQ